MFSCFSLCSLHQFVQTKLSIVLGIVVGRIEFVPQREQSAAHFLQGIEDGPHLVRLSGQPINGQNGNAVDPSRREINKRMLVPGSFGVGPPCGSHVPVRLNDDAHVVVSDVGDDLKFLVIQGLCNQLDLSVLINGPLQLGFSEHDPPAEIGARFGNHRPEPFRHPSNTCSVRTGV